MAENRYGHFTSGGMRGQDGVDVAAGLQAEDGAAVVEQVELDVAAAADQLLLALGLASRASSMLRRTSSG